MENLEIILVSIVSSLAFIFGLKNVIDILIDKKKYNSFFVGISYRRKYGLYNMDSYLVKKQGIKKLTWLKQDDSNGLLPESFNLELKLINYFHNKKTT